jgi:KDO2-lipid IV(A) lauroyltransferase
VINAFPPPQPPAAAWLHRLGGCSGWLTYKASPTYRRHLRENMVNALGREDEAPALRAAIVEAGRPQALELPFIWMPAAAEVVASAVREVSAGSWSRRRAPRARASSSDAAPGLLRDHRAVLSHPCADHRALSAAQAGLAAAADRGGAARGQPAPGAGRSVRRARLLKALKRGEAVGMLPDQVPGAGEGAGGLLRRPAYTMTLAARLAE